MQSAFDSVDFKDVDYSEASAKDSKVGKLFKVILILYASDGSDDGNFQFETFVIWGAMRIGERYNGERTLVCFRNLPLRLACIHLVRMSLMSLSTENKQHPMSYQNRKYGTLYLN